ncbi:MAG: ABC transporter permease [Acidobacteriota bacterium]
MLSELNQACRALAKSPLITLVIVATMALSMSVNTTVFSVVNGVLLRPLGYSAADGQLVALWERNRQQGLNHEQVSAATYVDWRERSKTFEEIAAYRYRGHTFASQDGAVNITSLAVSPSLFSVLGVAPLKGRTFQLSEETPGNERMVVLSYDFWQGRFGGDPGIVDSAVRLDGAPHTVVGVMPEGFHFPPGDLQAELWIPLTLSLERLPSRPHRMYNVIGKLSAEATLQQAEQEMGAIASALAQEYPDSMQGWGVLMIPAHEELVGGTRQTLWFLMASVALVLLIGCANTANLLLARSARRVREFAVRSAMGAGPSRLVRRLLLESLILSFAGGTAGLLISIAALDFFKQVIPAGFPRAAAIGIDWRVLAFAAALSLATGVLFGLAPVWRLWRTDTALVLQEAGRGLDAGAGARRLRSLLVVSEVALAMMLLVGSGLLIKSFARLTEVSPGFRKDNLTAFALKLPQSRYPTSAQQKAFFTSLVEKVRSVPGVDAAGAVTLLPMSPLGLDFDMPFTVASLDARSPTQRPRADYRGVIPGYFKSMAVPLVKGRLFDEFDDREGRKITIVNRSLAEKYFPERDPIGQTVSMPMIGEVEIVGVVGDMRHRGLGQDARPEIFVPFSQLALREMQLVVFSSIGVGGLSRLVASKVREIDPEQPVSAVSTIQELLSRSVAQPRFNLAMLTVLAGCATLLAAVGIYSVVSYSTAERTSEIGLRMALGSNGSRIARLVLGQSVRLMVFGGLLGALASAAFSRTLQGLLFAVSPLDFSIYLAAVLLVIALGAAAAAIPAWRAARLDPLTALRHT